MMLLPVRFPPFCILPDCYLLLIALQPKQRHPILRIKPDITQKQKVIKVFNRQQQYHNRTPYRNRFEMQKKVHHLYGDDRSALRLRPPSRCANDPLQVFVRITDRTVRHTSSLLIIELIFLNYVHTYILFSIPLRNEDFYACSPSLNVLTIFFCLMTFVAYVEPQLNSEIMMGLSPVTVVFIRNM